MKVGIFSDVHGNLESLNAVLDECARMGLDRLWCLGDVVGYGANPNECVDRVREAAQVVILGNHDAACAGAQDLAYFNANAREAVLWTAARLDEDRKSWLRSLPLTESINDNLLVHASPFEPELWHYVHVRMRPADLERAFGSTSARAVFVGHSHQQLVLVNREKEYYRFLGTSLRMEPGYRYLVNVGSTGQPRDGDSRAAFAVYDTDEGAIALHRVEYDIGAAQRKIREAGLPPILADRLENGL
jgi:diadenosine tetraphosphatase ApaH/serine/threonine PP2A family protein phosphatase